MPTKKRRVQIVLQPDIESDFDDLARRAGITPASLAAMCLRVGLARVHDFLFPYDPEKALDEILAADPDWPIGVSNTKGEE